MIVFLTFLLSLKAWASEPVRVGIFDISFYNVDQLIPESLTPETITTPHSLYSPHGAAVASLIFNPKYGGSTHGKLLLMNTGIYYDDFYQGIQKAIELRVQVINVSLTLIDASIAELINQASREHGLLFVVSAGNAAERRGRSLPDYYKNLQAIVASCIDFNGEPPSFAQLDSSVDVLASCGRSNVRTQIFEPRLGVMDYDFGATSSAAPQVVTFVINHLHRNSSLSLQDFKRLLRSEAQGFYSFNGSQYPVLKNTQNIMMAEAF